MLPGAGSIAYVLLEVLPGLMTGRAARSATRSVEKIVNPNKVLNSAVREYSVAGTVENSLNLAGECLEKGMNQEAKRLYEKSLTGIHEFDPHIMFGLAKAEFALENYAESKTVLEALIQRNPSFKNEDAHLLFARVVERLGEDHKAREEYEVLVGYYSGAEAKYRYAMMLHRLNENEEARSIFKGIIETSQQAGKHYKSLNREWIKDAKKELSS